MIKDYIIHTIESFVRENSSGDSSGHDWWHIERVRKIAITIAKKESADKEIVEIAALLHDVCDHKLTKNQENCYKKLQYFLESLDVKKEKITQVMQIIKDISFKGANVEDPQLSIEGKIVMDADRLDAMGAIGIARTFAYGGSHNNVMYDPSLKPIFHSSFEEYKNSQNTTINHFYEKLLLLKKRLHTSEAKKIGEARHEYMEEFLMRFYKEWNGEA